MQSNDYPILRNCPFCGGEAEMRTRKKARKGAKIELRCRIACSKCHIGIADRYVTKQEEGKTIVVRDGYAKCIEAWNRRVDNG